MRRVFKDLKAIFLRQGPDRRHVAGLPAQMDRDNDFRQSPGLFRVDQFALQRLRREVATTRVNVDEVDLAPQ